MAQEQAAQETDVQSAVPASSGEASGTSGSASQAAGPADESAAAEPSAGSPAA